MVALLKLTENASNGFANVGRSIMTVQQASSNIKLGS